MTYNSMGSSCTIITALAFLLVASVAGDMLSPASAPTTVPVVWRSSTTLQETCKQTTVHYDLCMAALSADPSSKTADTVGLARVAILVAQKNASEMAMYLSRIYDDDGLEHNTSQLQDCLQDCAERYDAAGEQLTDATVALDSGAYSEAQVLVAASQAEVKLCQRGCQAVQDLRNILTAHNREVDRLCSIALAITKLIRPKS